MFQIIDVKYLKKILFLNEPEQETETCCKINQCQSFIHVVIEKENVTIVLIV